MHIAGEAIIGSLGESLLWLRTGPSVSPPDHDHHLPNDEGLKSLPNLLRGIEWSQAGPWSADRSRQKPCSPRLREFCALEDCEVLDEPSATSATSPPLHLVVQ